MKIEILADESRASFIVRNLNASVKVTPYKHDLYALEIETDESISSLALRLFHLGISYGIQESKQAIIPSYKPNRFKDDIMYLEHD
jgi:hypothetical protein